MAAVLLGLVLHMAFPTGSGWNDFAKNMRSAYRATGQADLHTYNLGVRLVRSAESPAPSVVTATERVSAVPAADASDRA